MNKFTQTDQFMKEIVVRLDTKEQLKTKFLYILDNYSKIRETYGITTPAVKKTELMQTTINQIKLL
ncbi:hypothetical protein [Pedobacter hiemivivus]|uniref:Uncharacterized protein n=1 Tax=Pedobacter hiemivivus TaxID=2530454 RepID=A0A4R0N9W9_9SPHI|nr:hypothetical protein [Pedobacter hiemivivus]TCC96980.1 hypothetical protein EZ444_08965 [Pedobacter hiemivivus]